MSKNKPKLAMLLGLVCLVIGFYFGLVPELRAYLTFQAVPCTIAKKKIETSEPAKEVEKGQRQVPHHGRAATLSRFDSLDGPRYAPSFLLKYEVNDKAYQTWAYRLHQTFTEDYHQVLHILDRYDMEEARTCWVEPGEPRTVILERSFSLAGLLFTLTGLLIFILGWIFWRRR